MGPVGSWRVKTADSIDGSSKLDLGIWEGHVLDIAVALQNRVGTNPGGTVNRLEFFPVEIHRVGQLNEAPLAPTEGLLIDCREATSLDWYLSEPPKKPVTIEARDSRWGNKDTYVVNVREPSVTSV